MKSNLWHKSQIGEQKLEVLLYILYTEQWNEIYRREIDASAHTTNASIGKFIKNI